MTNNFRLIISDINFRLVSMNILIPKLFQVYVPFKEKERRFHMKLNESGTFVFTMREDCPSEILACESELSDGIKEHYQLI